MSPIGIHGHVAPGFEPLREAFEANFSKHEDTGGACCLYLGGEPVVDLWGGVADETGTPWTRDTVQLVFSATKGVTAICAHLLVERGELDLDRPIADYWPEFGENGKGEIPVRWALSHKAGLAAVDGDLTLDQVLAWDPVVRAIAAQEPNWPPGTAHGYHARSFGWIVGEIVRRITGRSLGRFLADEVAGPLGLDLWVGLPANERARCARIVPPSGGLASVASLLGAGTLTARVMSGPSGLFAYDEMWNRDDILAAEMPSSNGVTNARSLAKLYASLIGEVEGRRLLRADTIEAARTPHAVGSDKVLFIPSSYGLGFMLPPALAPGCAPGSFGHPGAGGTLAFADPESGVAFGFVTTRMRFDLTGDPRGTGLVDGIYRSLRRRAPVAHRRQWGLGRPVIALHPLGLESSAFVGVGEALARKGMRTVALDLPGFGRTPAPERPLTPAVLAEPVISAAREMSEPPDVIGISMGGRVALEAALRAPEAFRSVVAIAPYLPWLRHRTLLQTARMLDPRIAEMLPLEHAWPVLRWLAALLESTPFLRDDEVAQAGVRFIYHAACPATRAAFLSAARELALDEAVGERGLWTRLASIEIPATFVWGERDQLISPAYAGPVARSLPRARQIRMPCLAHWWNGPHHRCLSGTLVDLLHESASAEERPYTTPGDLPTRPCLVEREPEPAPAADAPLPAEGKAHGYR